MRGRAGDPQQPCKILAWGPREVAIRETRPAVEAMSEKGSVAPHTQSTLEFTGEDLERAERRFALGAAAARASMAPPARVNLRVPDLEPAGCLGGLLGSI
ncbi:MAG TPA: hypothetical protein VLU06_01090, partial [Thermoanaerobaculia bacterium]|nr:hypothetical protein [Thermoanaerobaculia bacterium]